MKQLLIITLTLIFSLSGVFGSYYADVQIYVDETGMTTIDGISNYADLANVDLSHDYTSKDGKVWTLNITVEENFDNFIYELNLPKYSEINYIKTTPTFRIAEDDNRIQIIGTGENRHFVIIAQYTIDSQQSFIKENFTIITIIVFLILLAVLRIVFGFKLRRKDESKTNNKKSNDEEEKVEYDISILPERQQEIIKLLEKHGRMTQKDLESKMNIPKSSVSRNVKTLLIKGILKKESSGQSNYISLK